MSEEKKRIGWMVDNDTQERLDTLVFCRCIVCHSMV